MVHPEALGIVIMEDVGVVMDQQEGENHVSSIIPIPDGQADGKWTNAYVFMRRRTPYWKRVGNV
jgi:hypothetical protein